MPNEELKTGNGCLQAESKTREEALPLMNRNINNDRSQVSSMIQFIININYPIRENFDISLKQN